MFQIPLFDEAHLKFKQAKRQINENLMLFQKICHNIPLPIWKN